MPGRLAAAVLGMPESPVTAKIIDGNAIAKWIRADYKLRVEKLQARALSNGV